MTLRIEPLPPRRMLALAGEPAALAAAGTLAPTPEPLTATQRDGCAVLWMAPDERLLLLAPGAADAETTLRGALAGTAHLLADVSGARAGFAVAGPGLRDALAKLTPIDLSPAAFAPGSLRRTRLGQVAAILWLREAERAEVLVERSLADYAGMLLSTAAAPGTEPGYFAAT